MESIELSTTADVDASKWSSHIRREGGKRGSHVAVIPEKSGHCINIVSHVLVVHLLLPILMVGENQQEMVDGF